VFLTSKKKLAKKKMRLDTQFMCVSDFSDSRTYNHSANVPGKKGEYNAATSGMWCSGVKELKGCVCAYDRFH